jgi:hypothetical protein
MDTVQLRRRISKRVRRTAEGINLAADVNADVSVNVSETHRKAPRHPAAGDARPKERGKETQ